MRLTALIPLIGIFLIFNQVTEKALAWPTFLINDLGGHFSARLATHNLYFTYFGLCLLGFGSMLFSIFCPREIRDEPNIGKYVTESPSANSTVIAKDDFRTVLALRFARDIGDHDHRELANYPHELEGDFHGLMEELYGAVDFGDGDIDGMPEVMMGSGYLDFTELARVIWNHIRAQWAISQPFYDVAPKFARDIAYLKYKSLDYTRFSVRLGLAIIYLAGFLLLLKPTVQVFVLLLSAWLMGG
ncbi:hypothetical protein X747_28850 [Mesorhizobium sp. LNJC384A00]|uniref:hypothetical protein n=1 Tax=Mesorhizobium sp. LNJC384A00 TaxID=1287268 RepID=UPI0003CE46CB|nr:hypothetical protein [Mesorhizobium sp. LNJC384A00]ESY35309.1 hypothetical protein X747_28850 [Mesorhizobium sp. LNJC384A00]